MSLQYFIVQLHHNAFSECPIVEHLGSDVSFYKIMPCYTFLCVCLRCAITVSNEMNKLRVLVNALRILSREDTVKDLCISGRGVTTIFFCDRLHFLVCRVFLLLVVWLALGVSLVFSFVGCSTI